jgi:hypothetical protein
MAREFPDFLPRSMRPDIGLDNDLYATEGSPTILRCYLLTTMRSWSQRLASRHGDASFQKIWGIDSAARARSISRHSTFASATVHRCGRNRTVSSVAIGGNPLFQPRMSIDYYVIHGESMPACNP